MLKQKVWDNCKNVHICINLGQDWYKKGFSGGNKTPHTIEKLMDGGILSCTFYYDTQELWDRYTPRYVLWRGGLKSFNEI